MPRTDEKRRGTRGVPRWQKSRSRSDAAARVAQLEPDQLAAWISAAPEPQRSALAFFYLNEFRIARCKICST